MVGKNALTAFGAKRLGCASSQWVIDAIHWVKVAKASSFTVADETLPHNVCLLGSLNSIFLMRALLKLKRIKALAWYLLRPKSCLYSVGSKSSCLCVGGSLSQRLDLWVQFIMRSADFHQGN